MASPRKILCLVRNSICVCCYDFEEGSVPNTSNICTHSVKKQGSHRAVGNSRVEELSFRERQVVVLKETGHANAAIAKRLGINEATVATLLYRARHKGYEVVIVLPGASLGLPAEFNEEETEHGDDGKDKGVGP